MADRRGPTPLLRGPVAAVLLVVAFAIELGAVAFIGAVVLAAVVALLTRMTAFDA